MLSPSKAIYGLLLASVLLFAEHSRAQLGPPLDRVNLTATAPTQAYVYAPFEIPVTVELLSEDGDQLLQSGLILEVTAGANTELQQSTSAVVFSREGESLLGRAEVRAALIQQGSDGALTIALSGLTGAEPPAPLTLSLTAQPLPTRPTVIIIAPERVAEPRPTAAIEFAVEVLLVDTDGSRLSADDLSLEVVAGANTTGVLSESAVSFSGAAGAAVGTAQIRAELIRPGENGQLQLRLAGENPGRALFASPAVVLNAAEFSAYVPILLGRYERSVNNILGTENSDPFGSRSVRVFQTHNNGGNFTVNLDDFLFSIPTYDSSRQRFNLPQVDGQPALHITLGPGVESARWHTGFNVIFAIFADTPLNLEYSPPIGFGRMNLDHLTFSGVGLVIDLQEGVRIATLTAVMRGLPDSFVSLEREFILIDQLLSTVTLSIAGTVPRQTAVGEAIEVMLNVHTVGTLGMDYRKNLELNLRLSAPDAVLESTMQTVQFSGSNPVVVSLMVTPGVFDSTLTVTLASDAPAGVELVPAEGLEVRLGAVSRLVRVDLTAVPATTEVQQVAMGIPVDIMVEARGFGPDGLPFDGELGTLAMASAGAMVNIDQSNLNLVAGFASFVVTVIPASASEERITVTISVSGLPEGQPVPSLEIVVVPTPPLQPLNLDGDTQTLMNELILLRHWLENEQPDLSDSETPLPENLSLGAVTPEGYQNLLQLVERDTLDINDDDTIDDLDIRLILRFQAGLRDSALGELSPASLGKIIAILGLSPEP